ncbi:bifunctional Ankyrin repeat/Palmitoyltransferase [Babesia duncani]|uniref:Palmitoyltransferase n=1 Tax=Babesia duncani TaxID=323732 RepID=A0AAD9PP38_9APIC|nr:bifunctional Ankyrin repeat/Palmitoyltransferase [Babesia duncani]
MDARYTFLHASTPTGSKIKRTSSGLSNLECSLSTRNTSSRLRTTGDENADYVLIEAEMAAAATNREIERLQSLLYPLLEARDADNLNSICALHWACFCGNVEFVNSLLEIGCDVFHPDNINLETPIYFAIRSSSVGVVQLLLHRFGTEVLCHENRKQMTPFLLAASEFIEDNIISTLHVLELLYLNGASLEEQDSYGRTALMHASRRGCQFVIQWLLARGANLAHRDYLGNSVLHHACHGGNSEALRFLCKHGAINLLDSVSIAATKRESTALGICIMKRSLLQYTFLRLWSIQTSLGGRILSISSPYPILYWFLSLVNLYLFCDIYKGRELWNNESIIQCDVWFLNWMLCQCLWFITFYSDPGMAKRRPIKSQAAHISSSFEKDCCKERPNEGGPYETLMQSLHQQQGAINFDIYSLNNNSYKSSIWFPHSEFSGEFQEPLNPYLDTLAIDGTSFKDIMDRLENEQLNVTREKRAIYPHVAMERQAKCPVNYVDAIFGSLPISTVCITCNMIKQPRSHHCASCGVCMIRQDHHCAWVDNCIARNNQRSFLLFVLSIAIIILHSYHLLYLHAKTKIGLERFDFVHDSLHIIFGVVANAAWLLFVGYLSLRITRSMVTNVTFYEFLRKPEYIRLRFSNLVYDTLWDFRGLSVAGAIKNCITFWTLGD